MSMRRTSARGLAAARLVPPGDRGPGGRLPQLEQEGSRKVGGQLHNQRRPRPPPPPTIARQPHGDRDSSPPHPPPRWTNTRCRCTSIPCAPSALAAPFDGTVRSILHKPGERWNRGAEVVRMDTTEKQLRLDRAKALYKVAQIEEGLAGIAGERKQLATARLQAAKAELNLPCIGWSRGNPCPFSCEVLRIDVAEGQVVRMGDPLATVGDATALVVEMPVDRNATSGRPVGGDQGRRPHGPRHRRVDSAPGLNGLALAGPVPSAASAVVVVPIPTDGCGPAKPCTLRLHPAGRRGRRAEQLHCQHSGRKPQSASPAE